MNYTDFELSNHQHITFQGIPENYPVPSEEEILFYIQKNTNKNTVVYEINRFLSGDIDNTYPLKAYWIKCDEKNQKASLNEIQKTLAYGYNATMINSELFEFKFAPSNKLFYLKRIDQKYHVETYINGILASLKFIYVHVEDGGVFPEVIFVDIHGIDSINGTKLTERISFD